MIPANMTPEVSELFTRELTRVTIICFCIIFFSQLHLEEDSVGFVRWMI